MTLMPNFNRCVRPAANAHRHQRVGRVAADALAEPQAVEAQRLERVDHLREAAVVELGAHPEPEPDAHLHDAAMPCRMAAVSAMRETNGEWSVSSVCTSCRTAAAISILVR
jgi:hypothetical protein